MEVPGGPNTGNNFWEISERPGTPLSESVHTKGAFVKIRPPLLLPGVLKIWVLLLYNSIEYSPESRPTDVD